MSHKANRNPKGLREMMATISFLAASVLLVATIVSGAPVIDKDLQLINKEVPFPSEGSIGENDADVQDLHSLDAIMDVTTATSSSASHLQSQTANDDDKRSSDNKSEFILSDFTSSSDTPRDMAEYIFWTGDEASVSTAIKDFVDQGLLSVDDGKLFMEEVRYHLNQIQLRYGTATEKAQVRLDRTKYAASNQVEDEEAHQLAALTSMPLGDEQHHAGEIVVTSFDPKIKSNETNVESKPVQESDELEEEIKSRAITEITTTKTIKDEHLNEAHIVDLLNNEYSLEEIIYQLARILFSQSLSQAGHPEAEQALKKFADFLEKESKEGKMSPQVQKKVLDVLLMSLFDAMGDHGQSNTSPIPLKRDEVSAK